MAEKIEVVKEEFPEGYVLYIIRGFRGLGSLSIQTKPSSIGTSVSNVESLLRCFIPATLKLR